MTDDEKLAFYFLNRYVSCNVVSPGDRHLSECSITVVQDVEVTEALAVAHNTIPNTYVSAYFHCRHGWTKLFEYNLFGYTERFRISACNTITG